MPALPDAAEVDEYVAAHPEVAGLSRTKVIQRMLDAERRERSAREFTRLIDPDVFAGALRTLQDAADDAGVRPEVLAAAIPAAAPRILAHSLTEPKGTTP